MVYLNLFSTSQDSPAVDWHWQSRKIAVSSRFGQLRVNQIKAGNKEVGNHAVLAIKKQSMEVNNNGTGHF